ncbi:hypothetical protein [Arcanobacterium pinnipediorum]|uniref:DUF4439 domain-containing protein n=1 Tax=Arcanobacterium pinnipediorum TaxID=1503041 RepID=A0ABY5AID1_9ACTO|nr:hypothetical protein [Arcanobacterium pinnipediorum]USR79967.1 hypothetical protein NG665_03035 [Arcanobacterium pinnipediorum]
MTTTPYDRSRVTSWLLFISTIVTVCAVFILILVVMGTRLENTSVAPQTPSAAEEERQDIAVSIARVHATAQELQTSNPDATSTAILTQLIPASQAWLERIGGVWVPWPDGAPQGYENPHLDLNAPEISLPSLQSQLSTISDKLSATDNIDPHLSVSIATSARTFAANLADPAQRLEICSTPDVAALSSAVNTAPAIVNVDTARQWLEYHAALLDPGARQIELHKINLLTELTHSALENGGKDERHPIAPLPQSADVDTSVSSLIASELLSHAPQLDHQQRTATVALLCILSPQSPIAVLPGAQ